MKFYLSSYKFGNRPEDLAGLYGENRRVAIIPNALDVFPDGPRKDASFQKESEELVALGLQPEVVDLRSFYSNRELLWTSLNTFGGVWVLGGNTFVLRKAYAQSGFDMWLREHMSDAVFVYGGYSAGMCVLAPSLKGIDLVDDPEAVKAVFGEGEAVIWEGLGFLDWVPVPHFDSDHPESAAMNNVVAYLQKEGVQYRTLRDGDVVIL